MITITAIIRAKTGQEANLAEALLAVAKHVAEHEPDTQGFYISQDIDDAAVFTTYERFTDVAAKDAHNSSAAVAAFFEKASTLIDGPVTLHTSAELSAKDVRDSGVAKGILAPTARQALEET